MCLVCNPLTSQSSTTAFAKSHSEWMVSHSALSTMTFLPLQSQHSVKGQMTHQVTHQGCICTSHVQEISQLKWVLTDPWKSLLLRHCIHWIRTHPKVKKRLKYLATKASSSLGPNYRVFGHPAKKNLWLLSSLIIFLRPIMSEGERFPGYISCLIHFKSTKEKWGDSSPPRDNRR